MRLMRTATAAFSLTSIIGLSSGLGGCAALAPQKGPEPIKFAGDCGVMDPGSKTVALSPECLRAREAVATQQLNCQTEIEKLKLAAQTSEALFNMGQNERDKKKMDAAVVILLSKTVEVDSQCGISPTDRSRIFGTNVTDETLSSASALVRAALYGRCRPGPRQGETTCRTGSGPK